MPRDHDLLKMRDEVYVTKTGITGQIAGYVNTVGGMRRYRVTGHPHSDTFMPSELIKTNDPHRVIPGRSRV